MPPSLLKACAFMMRSMLAELPYCPVTMTVAAARPRACVGKRRRRRALAALPSLLCGRVFNVAPADTPPQSPETTRTVSL